MGLHNVVGDLYHKHVYRHIAGATSLLSDSVDFALTDIVIAPGKFINYLLAGVIGLEIYSYVQTNETSLDGDILKIAGIIAGTAMITYGFNYFRTPLEKTLDLDLPEKVKKKTEVRNTIDRINELSESPELTFDEVNNRVNDSIDSFVLATHGYKVKHAKKVKISKFSKYELKKGSSGLLDPFIQEIVIFSKKFLTTIAHEKAHLVGYSRESEAQFAGYVAMLESGDPSLQYLAYLKRLEILTSRFDLSEKKLKKKGLNKRTLKELKEKRKFLEKKIGEKLYYGKPNSTLGVKIRSAMLYVLGQKNVKEAYYNKPLKMMFAYDNKNY